MFFAFQAIKKGLKYVTFRLTTNQDLLQAHFSVKFGESLASVLHLIQGNSVIAFNGDENVDLENTLLYKKTSRPSFT